MGVLQLSLGEEQASQVAKLLANETAQKIMNAVSADSKSESEIAKELDLAASTVHYNVQKLVSAGILLTDEFTYSQKGKEVRYYRLASEHVVITVKSSARLAELAVGGSLVALMSAGIAFFAARQESASPMMMAADTMRMESQAVMVSSDPVVWPWILLGALCVFLGAAITFLFRRN
ncbi:MAG: ArsR/SmtB family transcription factor [Candidatus Woesearchaeota archaeon]